jgi:indole-3-glycerol phosphate synthase
MNILETIVEHKKTEVSNAKRNVPISQLRDNSNYHSSNRSLSVSLDTGKGHGIIAEYKRRSPSKGWFTHNNNLIETVTRYGNNAAAISILTDEHFFGGTLEDLNNVRMAVDCPLLRKDFLIDSYQIHEAKAFGADIILLIAAILSPQQVKEMAEEAKAIGLEVLLEIHNDEELRHICEEVDFVGINNRDLKTFEVDINRSIALSKLIPRDKTLIAESGIDNVEAIKVLKAQGFKGFLIGEKFMKNENPGESFENFIKELR